MKQEQLLKGGYYHIYNRGINGTQIFLDDENKDYFLKLIEKYLFGKVSLFAYCLMDNHFHMAIQLISDEKLVTQSLSNFLNAYAKAFNKYSNRTGSLFEKHFKRIRIKDEEYLKNLIIYIHINPQNHGIINDFRCYKYSSYANFISKPLQASVTINRKDVITLFEDIENMEHTHKEKLGLGEQRLDLQGSGNLAGQPNEKANLQDVANQSNLDLRGVADEGSLLVGLNKISIKDKFYTYIQTLQDSITSKLEKVDGTAKFREDLWERPEGGGGRTRVIENGTVFEKGGVNISAVHGALPESMQTYFGVKDADFFACGLSLVLHPKSPMVPTVHANWRYFEMYDKQGNIVDQWFGGGQDLTPYYLFDEDAAHFHAICKKACDTHNPEFYATFKNKCDDYFWNTHRNEARGVGGLFFDYCKATDSMNMDDWYDFVTSVGDSFLEAYVPIVERRKKLSYSEEQRDWQEIRRGRYVEFNLVHDKGTLFGLKTNGRIESILMSLPPQVQWRYDHHPKPDSEEERLLKVLKQPKNWVD